VTDATRRQRLTGLVVNARPNLPRADDDRLRAVRHDAATNGPHAANRLGQPAFRAHLLGRVARAGAGNPERAARLQHSSVASAGDGAAPHARGPAATSVPPPARGFERVQILR
jgi:hypothetical protein